MADIVHFARTTDGYQAWFALKSGAGTIRTGAVPGNFTVTVVNPGDTASSSPAVAESTTKPGVYKFTIPSAFLIANGVGEYAVVIEVNVPGPSPVRDVFSGALVVSLEDFDSLAVDVAAVGSAVTAVAADVWSEVIDGAVTAGAILARVNSWVRGKINLAGTFASYFAEDDVTLLFRNEKTPTTRDPA